MFEGLVTLEPDPSLGSHPAGRGAELDDPCRPRRPGRRGRGDRRDYAVEEAKWQLRSSLMEDHQAGRDDLRALIAHARWPSGRAGGPGFPETYMHPVPRKAAWHGRETGARENPYSNHRKPTAYH